ncbi:MAG: hypothetical protein LBV38_06235 [Alistipes sp.]|jgi:hypothetical protein|nr:hypothetical protein [Alistipes sp.]
MKRGQIFLCWFAIGLAIVAILMTLFLRIIPTVTITGETYIGVLVSLLGVCVTFAIGYQIVSTLNIKDDVKRVEELANEMESVRKELKYEVNHIRSQMWISEGFNGLNSNEYAYAIVNFTRALEYALKCDNSAVVVDLMPTIKKALDAWDDNTIYDPQSMERVIKQFDNVIDNCSECVLYDSHIRQIKEYRNAMQAKETRAQRMGQKEI